MRREGGRELLVLSHADVVRAGISVPQTIALVEEAFRLAGRGQVECPRRIELAPDGRRLFHGLAACVPAHRAVGIRWIAHYPGNLKTAGIPDTTSALILNSLDTGQPECLMDGIWFTYARTAAVTAVAAKYLARGDACVLGLIGAGGLARAILPALCEVCPRLERVLVFARRESSRRRYCDDMAGSFRGELIPVTSAGDAVGGADIVVSSTVSPPAPFLLANWLAPGVLVAPLEGVAAWETRLLSVVDRFLVDHADQARHAVRAQRPDDEIPEPDAELGDVVVGRQPGREASTERIVALSTGHAGTDVILARAVYLRALEKGLGTRLDLR